MYQRKCERYPQVAMHKGAIVKPHYKVKTANGLTQAVIDTINYCGWQAERINTMGRVIDTREQSYNGYMVGEVKYIPTNGTKGSADISATIQGRSVKIEIKIGKDRQSDDQRKYQQSIEKAGGIYVIIKTYEEFALWYKQQNFGINGK